MSTIIVLSAVTAPLTRAVGPFAVAIVDVPFMFAVPCTSLNLSPVSGVCRILARAKLVPVYDAPCTTGIP